MAVHPPTGPFPPNDGSNIFRRGMPKPTAKPAPPTDDPRPPEPAEPLDLDDEDALFGTPAHSGSVDDLDAALSGVMLSEPADDDVPLSAILLDVDDSASGILDDSASGILDESLGEIPAVNLAAESGILDDALADTRQPAPPSAADSSIFTGGPLPHTGVGSGWLDASASAARKGEPTSGDVWASALPTDLPQPPSTLKYEDAADLFSDLRGDNPPSDSVWVEADADPNDENTGRVSDSEVRRVFDTSRNPAGSSASMAELDLGGPESELIGGKGDALEFDDRLSDPDAGGSSIFDNSLPKTEIVTDADNVDFNIPVPGDHSHASSMSGRLPDVDLNADPDAVAADLFGSEVEWADDSPDAEVVEVEPADATDDRAPAIAAAVAAGALGGVGAAPPRDKRTPTAKGKDKERPSAKPPARPSRAAAVADDEDDDKAEPKGKKRGGIGGVLAGLATGLALGVGGFAIVYLTGLIPNEKKVAVANVSGGDSQAVAKVEKLTAELEAANEKVANAALDLKQAKDGVTRRQAALDEANTKAEQLDTDLTAAKKLATDAKQEATDTKKELTAAQASIDPLKKDLDAAKKVATDAMKDLDGAKKLATDATKERDEAKTALNDAKKDADEKAKLYADAGTKLTDAEKKLKAADDAVAGVVKELKAAKLLDDKDDASKLPDAIKKLAAVATSGDAKKAAEALIATQKERDDAKAAMTKADADAKTALVAATKAKTDADKLVADVMKAADDKVKTAAEEATKDLKKQLADATTAAKKAQDDLTAAKTTAKADAEAAMKAKLDDATAKATAAEKALDTKVQAMQADTAAKQKAMEADFAAKIAEARSGALTVVPAEMAASEKAGRSYADGVDAYRRRAFTDAEALFAAATVSQPADARYWYYLGLARTQTGTTGADDAFKKGAEMEARNKPSGKMIDAALERLGFADKERVNKYRR